MKWEEIKTIALNVAKERSEEAGYAGARDDYGAGRITSAVESFEKKLIEKLDLRPSEKEKCLKEEIGFPYEFSLEIKEWKGLEFYKANQHLFKKYF